MGDAPLWVWAALVLLLMCSATFSASETALFSLGAAQRARAPKRVRQLLAAPRDLLVTVLLANLVVNVLFFAFVGRLETGGSKSSTLLIAFGALLAVLVAGEILPKTLGLRAAESVSRLGAIPLSILVVALGPVRRFFAHLLERTTSLLGPFGRPEGAITSEALAEVIERSAERGFLENSEADFVAGILELDDVRVREIMTPRVDLLLLEIDGSNRDEVVPRALELHLGWLPVMDQSPDEIRGRVRMRDLLREPDRPVRQLVMPVVFVPEVADALDALRTLRENRAAEAIAVDEWGGTAGVVTIEDVFEEIVGELRVEGEGRQALAVPLGEGRYRVDGGLSIRDWNEHFGLEVVPIEFETVGGFVTALLGRIPRTGDVVSRGSLVLEVSAVRGRRVLTVDVSVAAPEEAAP